MPSINFDHFCAQVKTNCNISDAKFWGNYSICGLLLRLRELYRHENRIMLWEPVEQSAILDWIARRETLWHNIAADDFSRIAINATEFDPFDTAGINAVLQGSGLIYGAGYGVSFKPSFFVAELVSREASDNIDIYISGTELARDLSAYPAMLQDASIFVRRDALSILLWDKFEELKLRGNTSGILAYAFSCYGLSPEEPASEYVYRNIREISEKETETYVHHELGESFEGKKLGEDWRHLLSGVENRKVEFFLRGIKDILSDTSDKGLLQHIMLHDKKGSFGFYIALLGSTRKILFPDIMNAYEQFSQTGDWQPVEKARISGYLHASSLASRVLDLYRHAADKTGFDHCIAKEFLTPASP